MNGTQVDLVWEGSDVATRTTASTNQSYDTPNATDMHPTKIILPGTIDTAGDLQSLMSTDSGNVKITANDIHAMMEESLPMMVFEIMNSSWDASNEKKKRLVCMPVHDNRAPYVEKVIIVTSTRTQLYCVKNLSLNPHYQANRDHVEFMLQQIMKHRIEYIFLPSKTSHFMDEIVVINEFTPAYNTFSIVIEKIDFFQCLQKIENAKVSTSSRGNVAVSAGVATMSYNMR